jgi:hypothetical protein
VRSSLDPRSTSILSSYHRSLAYEILAFTETRQVSNSMGENSTRRR